MAGFAPCLRIHALPKGREGKCKPLASASVEGGPFLQANLHDTSQDLVIGCSASDSQCTAKVSASLAEAADSARRQVKSIIDAEGADTADLMQKHIDSSAAKLLVIDRDFQVELSLFDLLAGASSESRLVAHLLNAMPDAENDIAPENSLQSLTQLPRQEVTNFATRSAQAKLQVCIKIVARTVDGRPPDITDIKLCPILAPFYERLQYFIRHGSPPNLKTGAEAIDVILMDIKQKSDVGLSCAPMSSLSGSMSIGCRSPVGT